MSEFDHREHYRQSIAEMAAHAEGKSTGCAVGWVQHAREKYPSLHQKYLAAVKQINELWCKDDVESIEAFKHAVRNEIDGTKYFIDRYQEFLEGNPPLGESADESPAEIPGLASSPVQSITIEWTETKKLEEVVM